MLIDRINITYVGLAKPYKHTRKHKVTLLKLGCGPPHSLTISSTWQGTEHIYWLVDVHIMICSYTYIYKSPSTYTIGNPSTAAPKNVQIFHHTTRCLDQEVFNSHTHTDIHVSIYIYSICVYISEIIRVGGQKISNQLRKDPRHPPPSASSRGQKGLGTLGGGFLDQRCCILHLTALHGNAPHGAGRSLVGFWTGLLNWTERLENRITRGWRVGEKHRKCAIRARLMYFATWDFN